MCVCVTLMGERKIEVRKNVGVLEQLIILELSFKEGCLSVFQYPPHYCSIYRAGCYHRLQ